MPIGWFLAPYARRIKPPGLPPARYCVMDDFTALITADGGKWSEAEVLGNHAIVKVNASSATLQAIASTAGIDRIPLTLLDEPLSSLTNAQRTAIQNKIESLGYPLSEIREHLGNNIGTRTLREVLRFIARRRLKPRYDAGNDTIVLDGPIQVCKTPEAVDAEV